MLGKDLLLKPYALVAVVEVIRTGLVYKDANMVYAPNNQSFGGIKADYLSKWHEEMWTRNRDIGAIISERIGFADNIMKETLMQDATMALLARFNGTADIRAVLQIDPRVKENLSVDQRFVGDYRLDTTIAINQGPIYIRPHINLTKEVLKQDDHTALFRINLTNDGNKTLGPVYITDSLPLGLTFINSSLRPDAITERVIRWSLPLLQIGGKQSITLRASIRDTGSRFINLVDVSAQYNGGVVNARAACGFVLDWLPCCLTRPTPRPQPNALTPPAYVDGGWVPPQYLDQELNLSEYALYQEIPCSSCSSDIPENNGCSSCV